MRVGGPPATERQLPGGTLEGQWPPATRLVADASGKKPVYTHLREADCHTALSRGLAEYLALVADTVDGKDVRPKAIYYDHAEPEDKADYPSISVEGAAVGEYEPSSTVPYPLDQPVGRERHLFKWAEFAQRLSVDVWATDPDMRAFLSGVVEEALNPVEWMYGFRLVLPFYHGAVAVYSLQTAQYADTDAEAQKRVRRNMLVLDARIPALRVARAPRGLPRAVVEVSQPD